jgi:alpha-amylase
MHALPGEILKNPDNDFVTVSEAAERYPVVGEFDAHNFVSWADVERDLSAWLSNGMQNEALGNIYALEASVMASGDKKLIEDWRKLQTSDHFYYMCTKWFADGDVHKYFNPYETPYEAFIAYNNVLHDLRFRLAEQGKGKKSAVTLKTKTTSTTPKKKSILKVAPKQITKKVAPKKKSPTKKSK